MMILYNAIKHHLAPATFALARSSVLLLCLLFLLPGCAQTVTDKDVKGEEVEIIINLSGVVDTTNYRYFILLSGSAAPEIDITTANFFFFSPGQILTSNDLVAIENQDEDGILFYYQNYFSTWTDFIVLDATGVNLFNGPFSNTISTVEGQQSFNETAGFNTDNSGTSTQVKLRFPFSFTSLGNASNLFFQFLVVDADGDILDSISAGEFIAIEDDENQTRTDSDATTPASSANITDWEVHIF